MANTTINTIKSIIEDTTEKMHDFSRFSTEIELRNFIGGETRRMNAIAQRAQEEIQRKIIENTANKNRKVLDGGVISLGSFGEISDTIHDDPLYAELSTLSSELNAIFSSFDKDAKKTIAEYKASHKVDDEKMQQLKSQLDSLSSKVDKIEKSIKAIETKADFDSVVEAYNSISAEYNKAVDLAREIGSSDASSMMSEICRNLASIIGKIKRRAKKICM